MAAGKQTFHWSAEKLWIDNAYMTLLLAGTEFDLIFAPEGTTPGKAYTTWTDCVVLSCEHTAGENGGVLEKVSGEAESVTVTEAV